MSTHNWKVSKPIGLMELPNPQNLVTIQKATSHMSP